MARVRTRALARAAACASLLTCAPIAAQGEPIVRAGDHAALRCHPGGAPAELAARIADEARVAVDQALEQVGKFGQLPEEELTIDLYVDAGAFDAVRPLAQLDYDVDEFALRDQRRACVLLTPGLSAEVRAVVGLGPAARDALVRQVAWLCASQTQVGHDDPWLCCVFGAAVLDELDNPKREFGVDPRYDGRRQGYVRHLGMGGAVALAEWVEWVGVPKDLDAWRSSWEMAGWCGDLLADKSRSWPKKLLKKPRKLRTSNSVVRIRKAALGSVLGGNWPKVEARLLERMREAEFGWIAANGVVARRDGGLLVAGVAAEQTRLCRVGTLPKGPFAVQVKARLHEVGDELWRVYFYHDSRTLSVFVEADRLHVQSWDGEDWTMVDSCRFDRDRYDLLQLRCEVRDDLTVFVDGEQVLKVPCKGFEMRDEVGVAVNDSVLLVEELTVEKVK